VGFAIDAASELRRERAARLSADRRWSDVPAALVASADGEALKPNANAIAMVNASALATATGAKYTICIAADVDPHAGVEGGHICVGTFCPSSEIVELVLMATLKNIQRNRPPSTVAIGRGKGKRGVW